MIKGHGASCAEVFLIGDCGSKDDMDKGYALSGSAERLLRSMMSRNGLYIDQAYRTLLFKSYRPSFHFAKTKRLTQLMQEIRQELAPLDLEEILCAEIAAIKPNVIVPLGPHSLRFLAGVGPHSKYRGSILHLREDLREKCGGDKKIIPTFSPEEIYADYTKYSVGLIDFEKKISPESRTPKFPFDPTVIWICRTGSQALNFFNRNKTADFATFDIETFQGIPTCISVSFNGIESVSFPLNHPDIPWGDQLLINYYVSKFLDSDIPKVAQNGKYDRIILKRFGFRVRNYVGDTMLAFHTLYPELASRGGDEGTNKASVGYGKNLGFLTSVYTSQPYFKNEGKTSQVYPPDTQHLNYNAKDSLVEHQIYQKELIELDELGLTSFYKDRVMPLFFLYEGMEERGFRIDLQERAKLKAKYDVLFELEVRSIQNLVGNPKFNPLSAPQVCELIYDDLQYPARRSRDTGAYTSEEEVLDELFILHGDENILGSVGKDILSGVLACRKLHKCLEYIETPIHPDERLRCSWNLAGTETGRSSGSKTTDTLLFLNRQGKLESIRLGRSLQTITKHGFKLGERSFGKDIRKMFVASRGYTLIEGDQSQAEARHVAILAMDWETLSILERTKFERNQYGVKDDLHTITATWVLERDFSTITEHDRQEYGKPARHGGNYGMTPKRFSLMYHKPYDISKKILDKFHEKSSNIRNVFWAGVKEIIQNTRCLTNCYGRRRDFLDRMGEDLLKEAYAYMPQGGVSDHQKFAMLRIFDAMPVAYPLVEAHDSTLAEVPIGREEEYRDIYQREIQRPISYRNCSLSRDRELVVPGDLTIGENWGEMQKI